MGWISAIGEMLGTRSLVCRMGMLCLLLSGFSLELRAQNWNEWLRQKKTQRRYLAEQLVALKVYAGYLKKGYDLVDDGLGTIRDLGRGEFNLHGDFLASLKEVSPQVRRYGRLAEVVSLQAGIIAVLGKASDLRGLAVQDRALVNHFGENILAECLAEMEALLVLLSAEGLELSQAARMERMEAIYASMVEKDALVRDFAQELGLLIGQREMQWKDWEMKGRLYGIPD